MKVITELKDFQKDTLQRMLRLETEMDGGLLLNEAGLGKSICALGLMSAVELKTLIVCPAGLVDNWINEFSKHTDVNRDEIIRFYGSDRKIFTRSEYFNKNIWITSYTTLIREKKYLKKLQFTRFVLDEAHYIRNYSTNTAKAIFELVENTNSKRWAVTATPIYNGINDAYSYFKFLNFTTDRCDWRQHIGSGIQSVKKVNELIKIYGICYQKQSVLRSLKPKNEIDMELTFSREEQEFYNVLKDYSRSRLEILIKRIKNVNTDNTLRKIFQMHVLTYILRLKQTCNSPNLVINKITRLSGVSNVTTASRMLRFYNESQSMQSDCPICLDVYSDIIINPCGHKFCKGCYEKLERHRINNCPMCRQLIVSVSNIVNPMPNIIEDDQPPLEITSTKITNLCNLVTEILNRNEKVVIVSQWVEMLDLMKSNQFLKNIKYVTLQGDRTIPERMESIDKFEKDDQVKICFLSMTSSAEGINLVSANNLILVDSWWNNALMIQVMNRVHRIGQIKDVNIYKMRIQDTIESNIKKLVNKKHKISKNIVELYDEENLVSTFEESVRLIEKRPSH